jgi:GEVED domain
MRSTWRMFVGTLALVLVGLGVVWTLSYQPAEVSTAARLAGEVVRLGSSETLPFTFTVSGPYTPTLSLAVRDLPLEPDLPTLDREPIQRDARGFVGPDIQMPPHGNPLADLQASAPEPVPDDFGTPILNFAGVQDNSSPPDDTGDVGPNHYLQADNGPSGSRVTIFDKAGVQLAQFYMDQLASGAPCNNGYCDPIVQYDELADRWMISEFDANLTRLCVYVSKTPDPTGQWWAYAFSASWQDYPKYGVWPDGYYVGANNGGVVHVLERNDMLNGQPATMQSFTLSELPGFGFQLTEPATLEGDAPPAGSPAIFLRPRDTEIHGGTCPGCDLMELWAFHVDWTTPANSSLTSLPGAQLTDWDQTLCGTGSDWSCMSQPGTAQKLDPIREPVHYPTQYRNFGTHETLVGCFAEDVDGLDRAAVHWFELRRTPPGVGNWVKYQEGVLGDGVGDIHRSVCSAAMDSAGNIAVGYTRTGSSVPYYPSIYYSGRRASDPLGTMPYYDNKIWDATNSKLNNERWGDYSGIGVDPSDGCTFWYTTEYGGNGQTRIASFKFDECGTPDFTMSVSPDLLNICSPGDAVYSAGVGAIGGFSNPVTLSSTGQPAGTLVSFMPNPLNPPGESLFTISNTGAAAPGSYDVTVLGTADGSPGHQDTVVLNLFNVFPALPQPLLPVDGATGVPTPLTYDWNDVENATSYDIEISTDPDFIIIVDFANDLPTSTYVSSEVLALDTVHYWRVRANNPCGNAGWVMRAFRTAGGISEPRDYSDLPAGYSIAWHSGNGALRLGSDWTADDVFSPAGYDDGSDDGITFPNGFVPGESNAVRVNVQGTPLSGRWLSLWFDWDGDGIFGDQAEGELVYSAAVEGGNTNITVDVPGEVVLPVAYQARLFDSAASPLRDAGSWGGADGGEVEDYTTINQCGAAGLAVLPASADQSGMPGKTITYSLTVANLGTCTDTFTVEISGNNWITNASVSVGPLEPDEEATLQVTVTIPVGANEGDFDEATIALTSQADLAISDSSMLTTTALAEYKMLIPLVYRP